MAEPFDVLMQNPLWIFVLHVPDSYKSKSYLAGNLKPLWWLEMQMVACTQIRNIDGGYGLCVKPKTLHDSGNAILHVRRSYYPNVLSLFSV